VECFVDKIFKKNAVWKSKKAHLTYPLLFPCFFQLFSVVILQKSRVVVGEFHFSTVSPAPTTANTTKSLIFIFLLKQKSAESDVDKHQKAHFGGIDYVNSF
jgi:hypothetical protein